MRRPALLLLPSLLALAGCVDRLIDIRTEPSGATVFLDGEAVGSTPVEVPYVWYGTRELVIEKSGFRPVQKTLSLSAPWWQYPPFDFITDVVIPFTLTDREIVSVELQPAPVSLKEVDEVIERAEELRKKAATPK